MYVVHLVGFFCEIQCYGFYCLNFHREGLKSCSISSPALLNRPGWANGVWMRFAPARGRTRIWHVTEGL
jgi:hypothetical protein